MMFPTKITQTWAEQSTIFYYVLFYIATNFVNKYVLSVLNFTYPTIFQGWQVLAGGLILWGLAVTGYVTLKTNDYQRPTLLSWSPAMLLYTISIYAGSVSLASLPIPMFMCFRCLITIANFIIDYIIRKKVASQLVLLPVLLSCVLVTVHTDPQFAVRGYLWATVHVISVVLYEAYVKFEGSRISLGSVDRVFCNYVFSIILLAPCSMLLGDVMAAKNFEFFYFYKFYMGCFASGVFGTFLCLQGIKLKEAEGDLPSKEFLASFSKIVTSFLSLLLFNMSITATNILSVSFTLGTELLMLEHFGKSVHSSNVHMGIGDIPIDHSPTTDVTYALGNKPKTNGFHKDQNGNARPGINGTISI